MRAARPDELREHALPIFTAQVSNEELRTRFPVDFQEITDPWTAAEPSDGALLQLKNGDHFVVYRGRDSGTLTIRIASSVDAARFLEAFFREVPLQQERVTWMRDGVKLPRVFRALDGSDASRETNASSVGVRNRILSAQNDADAALIRAIAEIHGYEVDSARKHEDVADLLARNSYVAILLDIDRAGSRAMAVIDGITDTRPELLRRVVLMTAQEPEEVQDVFPDVCEILQKPVASSSLLAVLARFAIDGGRTESLVS